VLMGILGNSLSIFPGSKPIMALGLLIYLLSAFIYGIIALVKKQNRVEGGMMALSGLLVLGLIFKIMYWPGGGPLIVIGSPILLFGSIGLLIYSLVNNHKLSLTLLFVSIGISSIFFCFKFMRWPGASLLFFPGAIGMITAIVYMIVKQVKLDSSKIVLITIMALIVILFSTSSSALFRFRHINLTNSNYNSPEHYHEYANILYNEGKYDEALLNVKLAIQEVENPNNLLLNDLVDSPTESKARYERALNLINSQSWNELEEPKNLKR
jgi:hypothetical protein